MFEKRMTAAVVYAFACVVMIGACRGAVETEAGDPDAPDTGASNDRGMQSAEMGSAHDTGSTDVGSVDDTGRDDLGRPDASSSDAGADVGVDQGVPSTHSAGCVDGDGLPEGEYTFTLEERDRRVIVRLPQGYSRERAWPLVFALHGNGGSVSYWDGTSGDRNVRGVLQDEAVLMVAEAIEGNWRDYDAPEDTWPARIESELAYFDTLIELAKAELCIDEAAIFSMGFSGGGSFSGVLGCRRTDIRAIAVGGSVSYFDEADCVGTPAAWITIGTEELNSGREAFRDWFRDRAGCAATSTATEPAPCVAYDGCDDGAPVHYCQHPGGHVWPDFGTQASWDFFRQFVTP